MKKSKTIVLILVSLVLTQGLTIGDEDQTQEIKVSASRVLKVAFQKQDVLHEIMKNSMETGQGLTEAQEAELKKQRELFNAETEEMQKIIMSSPVVFKQAIEIIRVNKDKDIGRFLRAWGISGIDTDNSAILEIVLELLEDPDPDMQKTAIYALTPKRKPHFHSQKYNRSIQSVGAITKDKTDYAIKNEKARTALKELFTRTDEKDVKKDIIWALTYSQKLDNEITEMFIETLRNEDDVNIINELTMGFITCGLDGKSVDVLAEVLNNTNDKRIKSLVASALAHYPFEDNTYNVLLNILHHEEDEIIKLAIVSNMNFEIRVRLKKNKDAGAPIELPKNLEKDLKDILPDEKSDKVKEEIKKTLEILKTK